MGEFDPALVAAIAAGFEARLDEVHRDQRSVVRLDREPLRWEGSSARGIAWSERLPARGAAARGWREAASRGACGLVVDGDRRAVHASGSGVLALYAISAGDAVYFSTAIDQLARAGIRPLSPDWESWAQIIALGYPPGRGTPFAEITRLEPLAAFEHWPGSAPALVPGELPWTEVDQLAGRTDVAERVVAGLRDEIAGLDPELPVLCPLTGGWDSRLLACLLAEGDREFSTWTVGDDWRTDYEEELAAEVAGALGVPHTVVRASARAFPDELLEAAALVEHQSILRFAFLARLAAALPEPPGVVVDGFAGGFVKGDFGFGDLGESSDWRVAALALFDRFVPPQAGERLLRPELWRSIREHARDAWMTEAERFAGHPAAAQLTVYWTRIRRRIGVAPTRIFGADHGVAMPFLSDSLARSALEMPLAEKRDGRLYDAVFEIVNPAVGRLPSTHDGPPRAPQLSSKLAFSEEAQRTYRSLLERSPLLPEFSDRLRRSLELGRFGGLEGSYWLLERLQSLCNLTIWLHRYADLLGHPDLEGPLRASPASRRPAASQPTRYGSGGP